MAEKVTAIVDDPPSSPEAVKTEESGRDGTSSDNRPSSPEPNCAICLSGPKNKSFTDSCFHQFCFSCLLEWSKVKAECPLCKQAFRCIIHNIRSLDDYDKYLVQSNPPAIPMPSNPFAEGISWIEHSERFRYRTTMVNSLPSSHLFHENVQQLIDALHQRYDTPNNYVLPTTRSSRRRNALSGTSDFRRNIYRQNLWVRPQPDLTGRFRESSPEFYRLNEAATHRLAPWLNRELNVLVPNAEQQAGVMETIMREIRRYPIRSPEFLRILTPIIGPHTRHFLHEFYSYAISTFDMIGYDLQAQYVSYPELGQDPDAGYEISSDNDSDIVEVLTHIRNEDSNVGSSANQSTTAIDDGNDSDCIVVDEVNAINRPIEVIDVLSDGESEADGTIESLPNPESVTVNVSSLSSDDGFCFIDEFPQVKNTTIPQLKLRDLRDLVDDPFLPSTSNVHPCSISKRSRVRKSRVGSLSLDTSSFHSDSGEEWQPTGSKMRRKKKKKKSKSCCCEKLKKHWKKECLSAFKSDSDTLSDLDSDSDSNCVKHQRCHPKFVRDSIRCKSSSNIRKKSASKKKAKQRLNCDQELSSESSVDSDVSLSDSSCYSADENVCHQRQLRNKTKKSQANSEKKYGKNSKRKAGSQRKSGKNKSRKHLKLQGNYAPSPLYLSGESFSGCGPTSPISSTESEDWHPALRQNMCLRSTSTESEEKSKKKKSKSSGKKSQQVRNSAVSPLNSVINDSDIDLSAKNDRIVLIDDESTNYFVPEIESCSSPIANADSDLESNNSCSGRPRLKSVVRVVNPSRRNSDSVPHYEIVSSSLCDPCPGPSTSRSSENSGTASIKSILKKKCVT